MLVIAAILAVRELQLEQWRIDGYHVDTNQAYGLAAPIATSLVGGGPAVMLWGLAPPNHPVDITLTPAPDGSLFPS